MPVQTSHTSTQIHPTNTFITIDYDRMFGNYTAENEKEAPQEWVPIPNELEDIIGERCTDGKYIICIYCNEFDPQGGKVKFSHQR